jgi:replication factor C subunit 1
LVARAADFLSLGDVVNRNVRQRQNWSLSPAAVLIGSVAPAAYMRGNRETFGLYPGEMNFPRYAYRVVQGRDYPA